MKIFFFMIGLLSMYSNMHGDAMDTAIKQAVLRWDETKSYDPEFCIMYQTLQTLKRLDAHAKVMVEQCNKVPWYDGLLGTANKVGIYIKNMPLRLQIAALGGLAVVCANMRLYRLRNAYYAAWDEREKEHRKRAYASCTHMLLHWVELEKKITIPLRDAAIGFWGNGKTASDFFSWLCDWCSVRSLVYIDSALLE